MLLKKSVAYAAIFSQIFLAQQLFAQGVGNGMRINSAYSMVKERSSGAKIFNTVVYVSLSGAGIGIFKLASGFGDENVSAAIIQKFGYGVGGVLLAVGVAGLILTWTDFADAGTVEDYYAQHFDQFLQLPEDKALRMLNSPEGANLRKALFSVQQVIIETEN